MTTPTVSSVPADLGPFAIRHNVLVTPHQLVVIEHVLGARVVADQPVSTLSRALAGGVALAMAMAALLFHQPIDFLMGTLLIVLMAALLRREARIELITTEGPVLAETLRSNAFDCLTASRTLDARAEELAAWINEAVAPRTKL